MSSRPVIALAEDNAELRELFASALERSGFEVVRAKTGADLVEKVRARSVQLIVADVRMPELDGFAAVRALRASGIDTPVIFVTAFGDADVVREAQELNSRLIDKPLGLSGLRIAVAEALGRDAAP